MTYSQVQQIAKDTIAYARQIIKPGINLRDIRRICESRMLELGADSFWYWDVGAFVFAGNETALSISGREYVASDRTITSDDIITIDLSPQNGDIWGDYARTIVLQKGVVVDLDQIDNPEWRNGLIMEDFLHNELRRYAKPETTFEEIYYHMNALIESKGYINLDFAGNLGHSIAQSKDDRVYIEKGSQTRLGDIQFFTFEPHISVTGSSFGYKKENIYSFENGILREL